MRNKGDDLTKPPLANHGGRWDESGVQYSETELTELLGWATWQDPLKSAKREDKSRWFDGTKETPLLPNWAHIRKRNLWVCHYAGVTLEVGPTLEGHKWILYLEGQTQLGEPGELEVLKEKGTGLLLMVMLAKREQKEGGETE